jgi:hypothetical protein
MAVLTFLPLDLSGKARSNLRENETHPLIKVPGKADRIFVTDHGAFYSASMVVRDSTTRSLVPGTDYTTVYHYAGLSDLTAKEVMGLVVVKNPTVQGPITVEYQAVGGHFSISVKELKALLASLAEENFSLKWEDIIGKPTAYVPKDHGHEWWQLWGMETTVTEIDRIGKAWAAGTKAIVAANTEYANDYVQKGRDAIDAYAIKVNAHLVDQENPHATDKFKVHLDYINNWAMATGAQVLSRTDSTHYMPIGGMYRILNEGPLPDLAAHVSNFNNPHGTKAVDANCWTIAEIDQAFTAKYLWTDTAANSTLWNGRNQAQARQAITTNLNPSDINTAFGGFPHTQLGLNGQGIGFDTWNWALCGDGVWRRWSDLLATYNSGRKKYVSAGRQGSAQAGINWCNAIFQDMSSFPIGTQAMATIYQNPTPDVWYDYFVIYEKVGQASWVQIW